MWTSTHVFSAWEDIAQRLKAARRVLMLSDYDGPLTPIAESPEKATIPEPTRELIRSLARQSRLTVGIISGRALGDLQTMVAVRGIVYAGNHGLEIEGPGWRFIAPLADEFRPVLRLLHRVLSRALSPVSGAVVEDKGLSLTVHYRQVGGGRARGRRACAGEEKLRSPARFFVKSPEEVHEFLRRVLDLYENRT